MDTRIIDSHTHVGVAPFSSHNWTAEELLASMDKAGISKAIIFPPGGGAPLTDYHEQNTKMAEAMNAHPDRLLAVPRINPHYGNKAVEEAERCIQQLKMKGLKLHPDVESWVANSPIINPIWEVASRYKVPVIIHTWYTTKASPYLLMDAAERFRDVTFILAHMGGPSAFGGVAVAKRNENVMLDISTVFQRNLLEAAVDNLGSDRLIFASDWPFFDQSTGVHNVTVLNISDEDKRKIFGENVAKIFKA